MKTKILLLSVLGAASLTATANVTLDSCRNMALRNNRMLKVADEVVKSAQYERKAAFASYLPGIDFSGGYTYNQRTINLLGEDAKLPTMSFNPATQQFEYNLITSPDGTPIKDPSSGSYIPSEVAVIPKEAMSFDTHNVFAGAFTLTQPVFMGGQIRALNDIAKYGEQLADASRSAATQEVIYNVDEAYWRVVSLDAKKRLADSFVNLVDTLCYNVEQMLNEGVATRSDLLTVQVKLNEAQIARTKVDNGLILSRMALAQICGLPTSTEIEPEDNTAVYTAADALPEYNIDDVYSRRSDLEVLRKGINILESRERLSLGTMLPKIGVFGAWSFSNPNLNNGFKKRFGAGFSAGAVITVPLWHWGGDYNRYRAAKASTQAQRMLLEDAEEKVQLQVSQAGFSMQEAVKTYNMTVANLEKANENLENANYGFHEGVLTTDDVIAAQTAWLLANSEKIDAEIGVRLCKVYLSKVLGRLEY